MTNPYYVATGTPGTSSTGASAAIRSEYTAIQSGFDKLPDYSTGTPGAPLVVNGGATGIAVATGVVFSTGALAMASAQDATSSTTITNTSAGVASRVDLSLNNGTDAVTLRIFGTGYTTSGLDIARTAQLIANTLNFTIGTSSAQPVLLVTSGVERMRISAAGLVGIGVTPAYQLDILNTQNSTTNLNVANLSTGTSAAAGLSIRNSGPHIVALSMTGVNYVATVAYDTQDGCFMVTDGAGGFNIATVNAVGTIKFYTGSGGGSAERMRISAAGLIGIGMTPANIFDVTQNTTGNAIISIVNPNTGVAATARLIANNGTSLGQVIQLSSLFTTSGINRSDGMLVTSSGTGGLTLNTLTAQPIYFGINSVEMVRIDATGNVGIGTLAPGGYIDDHSLVVKGATNGNVIISGPAAGTSVLYFRRNDTATTQRGFIQYDFTADYMRFATNGAEVMRVDTSGNMFIANTVQFINEKFQVNQAATAKITAYFNNSHATPAAATNVIIGFGSSHPNNTTSVYVAGVDDTTTRWYFNSNGGLGNFSANNINLSDYRMKNVFQRYNIAELDALEESFVSVDWGKYKYNDQSHDDWNHGYTAQGVGMAFHNSAPELVDDVGLGPKDGPVLKGVYGTDLNNISMALLARLLRERRTQRVH